MILLWFYLSDGFLHNFGTNVLEAFCTILSSFKTLKFVNTSKMLFECNHENISLINPTRWRLFCHPKVWKPNEILLCAWFLHYFNLCIYFPQQRTAVTFGADITTVPLQTVTCCGSKLTVPLIVYEACNMLKCHVHIEGLFRKAGSQTRQKDIKVCIVYYYLC